MILYLTHGRDPLLRTYHALLILARDEPDARGVIAHESKGFRVDNMRRIEEYPQLDVGRAVIARITLPEPVR
jgi:hypothetical protein